LKQTYTILSFYILIYVLTGNIELLNRELGQFLLNLYVGMLWNSINSINI